MKVWMAIGLAAGALGLTGGGRVDHSALDALLKEFVHGDLVDYWGLKTKETKLAGYVRSLASVDDTKLNRNERMALFINAYNACTLTLILDHLKPRFASIMSIPEANRWKDKRWNIGGRTYSLDEIENFVLRAQYGDPRIHAAINCASIGCPALRAEAFTGAQLESQLDEQFRRFVNDPAHVRVQGGALQVSAIFDWFKKDFTKGGSSVVALISRFADDELRDKIHKLGGRVRVTYRDYDWSLNAAPRREDK